MAAKCSCVSPRSFLTRALPPPLGERTGGGLDEGLLVLDAENIYISKVEDKNAFGIVWFARKVQEIIFFYCFLCVGEAS
jgi:hypothetical protein